MSQRTFQPFRFILRVLLALPLVYVLLGLFELIGLGGLFQQAGLSGIFPGLKTMLGSQPVAFWMVNVFPSALGLSVPGAVVLRFLRELLFIEPHRVPVADAGDPLELLLADVPPVNHFDHWCETTPNLSSKEVRSELSLYHTASSTKP